MSECLGKLWVDPVTSTYASRKSKDGATGIEIPHHSVSLPSELEASENERD
jgi:hypothetical protein